jgi:hypothetical protein
MEIGLDAPAITILRTLTGRQCLAASMITSALDLIICNGLVGQTAKDIMGLSLCMIYTITRSRRKESASCRVAPISRAARCPE